MNDANDLRLYYPATLRNREPILEVLREILPSTGQVLEISSGSGEHAVYFAQALSSIQWTPSDPDLRCLASIDAWRKTHTITNLQPPVFLDVCQNSWPMQHADAIVNINMIHSAPWEACLALMKGCATLLDEGGVLFMYGPYKIKGEHTSDSNFYFDMNLRDQNSQWGVRDLDDVIEVAHRVGLIHQETRKMPANNLSVIYQRKLR